MATKVVQKLPYFSEVPKYTIFYDSRSSKEKNNSVFKKCLKYQVLVGRKIEGWSSSWSADQMQFHRNESGSQKSLNFSGNNQSCIIKENNHLTLERSPVMTIVSLSNSIRTPPLEFVFKKKRN